MAGFTPAAGRVRVGRVNGNTSIVVNDGKKRDDKSDSNTANDNDDHDVHDDDIADSDSSSTDYDNPYHETALDLYTRHTRRRARRLAGISSSDDSSSSSCSSDDDDDGSISTLDGDDNADKDRSLNIGSRKKNEESSSETRKRKRAMERAIRSAERPLKKWLSSYPLVAARSCLSSVPVVVDVAATDGSVGGRGASRLPNLTTTPPQPSVLPRVEETKRLRRILRRLRRKEMEFRVKFGNKTSTSTDVQQRSKATTSNKYSCETAVDPLNNMKEQASEDVDHTAIYSFLPQGTGISFIDAVLGRESLLHTRQRHQQTSTSSSSSGIVLEINGPSGSGMTSIMLAVAARYVVSTSQLFVSEMEEDDCHQPTSVKRWKQNDNNNNNNNESGLLVTEPKVVILDIELGLHIEKLVNCVKEAVLRRWEETAPARRWKSEHDKKWDVDDDGVGGDEYQNTIIEQRQIELAIASCLGRINIVQPRDFTYLSLVATIELLRQALDKEKADVTKKETVTTSSSGIVNATSKPPSSSHQFDFRVKKSSSSSFTNATTTQPPAVAPTLVLIDSLTTLDETTRYLEGLPTTTMTASGNTCRSSSGSGLSDRNSFYRQLMRLREAHDVTILAAAKTYTTVNGRTSSSSGSLWDKMVSHRVSLHHAVEGTPEDQAGFEFVAILNNMNGKYPENECVYPYSITAGGIAS